MSGPKIAALYGLIPNKLGFCGPRQKKLREFIRGKLGIPEIIPVLKQFEAAYPYYQLIAKKNKIKEPLNKRVVEAYWIGNELLDKIKTDDLRKLIVKTFSGPGLLSKKQAEKKAAKIPEDSKPHHSFHVLILGSITGRVNFENNTKLKDICRISWGRVNDVKKDKIIVNYNPLIGKEVLKFGQPVKKELIWDKEILPEVQIGDWVSFHWKYAIQKLNERDILNLFDYTNDTLTALYEKK